MSILIRHAQFRDEGVNGEGGSAMRHFMNRSVLFLIGIICVGSVAFTTLAQAETLVESATFFRIVVGLSVDQKAAQAWLPAPWKVVSLPKGPFKGTNVLVIFTDWFIIQDGEGKPVHGGTLRCASLAAYGKNPQTGELVPFVLRVYAPYDDSGPFKNTVKAKVSREATIKVSSPAACSEVWKVQDSAGGIMDFRIDYKRRISFSTAEMTAPVIMSKAFRLASTGRKTISSA
jgi:hypothetical protein